MSAILNFNKFSRLKPDILIAVILYFRWFTWWDAEDFSVCYFLTDCPVPMNAVSIIPE